MSPSTWIFLRSAGSAWAATGHSMAGSAALSNLRTEIQHALSEGATWEAIADATLLAVETVKQLATKEATA